MDQETIWDRHPADRKCIAVAFDARSLPLLKDGSLTCFIRRKIPKHNPLVIYIYVNSPVSGIIGKAAVKSLENMKLHDAIDMASELRMTRQDIVKYIGDREFVGLMRLRSICLFTNLVTTDCLQDIVVFHPPQNFSWLNSSVIDAIEHIGSGGRVSGLDYT